MVVIMESAPAAAAPSPPAPVGAPFNRIIWPDGAGPVWMDTDRARSIPAVARALLLITGMVRQTTMDDYKGDELMPRPRVLAQPDPSVSLSWFTGQSVDDYLLHGNAVALVVARDSYGYPAAVRWVPACWVAIECAEEDYTRRAYWIRGRKVEPGDVIHVQRGADPWCPARGIGVVESHLRTLRRAVMEEEYELSALADGAVPSVAVVAPNTRLSAEEAEAAKAQWEDLYGGPRRRPGVFPAGTVITPLSWSPSDAELTEARRMTLVDVANIFGLDPYWVGGPSASLTYKSPGPMYTNLLRTTLEPILTDVEQVWGAALLPRGHDLRFNRRLLLADDLQTTVTTLATATAAGLMTTNEARIHLGLSPLDTPAPPPPAETDPAANDPQETIPDALHAKHRAPPVRPAASPHPGPRTVDFGRTLGGSNEDAPGGPGRPVWTLRGGHGLLGLVPRVHRTGRVQEVHHRGRPRAATAAVALHIGLPDRPSDRVGRAARRPLWSVGTGQRAAGAGSRAPGRRGHDDRPVRPVHAPCRTHRRAGTHKGRRPGAPDPPRGPATGSVAVRDPGLRRRWSDARAVLRPRGRRRPAGSTADDASRSGGVAEVARRHRRMTYYLA
ncbi:hypothetical protein Pen01_05580 [Phytomonospora endophytica]|nr:hypothetical protein Pen01_05580 [Phytomonospora endophytica]